MSARARGEGGRRREKGGKQKRSEEPAPGSRGTSPTTDARQNSFTRNKRQAYVNWQNCDWNSPLQMEQGSTNSAAAGSKRRGRPLETKHNCAQPVPRGQ